MFDHLKHVFKKRSVVWIVSLLMVSSLVIVLLPIIMAWAHQIQESSGSYIAREYFTPICTATIGELDQSMAAAVGGITL